MTFLDMFKRKHPEHVNMGYLNYPKECPFTYGLEPFFNRPCRDKTHFSCKECWNREMPIVSKKETKIEQTDIIKISSKAYQLIGCIEGLSYFLMKPEAQNLAQDNLCELTKIVDKLVDYAKGEAT